MTSSEDSKDNIDVPPKKLRLNLSDINAYITCVICKGYLINATTLTECLHSFCKTCIVRYLNTSKSCPICDVQVHKTKPLLNIRSDKTLQDIVYKMVPGLYKAEMRRRRQFYLKHSSPCETSPEERGEIDDRIIYSPDEKISLSLEFYTPEMAELYHKRLYQYRSKAVLGENSSVHPKDTNPAPTSIRYLCCPAAVTVHHLQRFIKMKFNLGTLDKVEIIYCGEVLKSNWTLMDVAYIYTWRRNGPIRFFFQIIAGQKRNFNWCLVPKSTKDTEEVADENNPPKLAVEKIDHCVNGEKETKVDKENDGAIHSSSNALNNIGTFINGKVPLKDNISLAIREKPVLASGDTATNSDKPQATINKSRLGVNQLPVPNGKLMTVSDKPTNVPVKIATVPNRPIQLNPAPVVHNTNQKSEGSKTIAELINERILKQKKHRVTSGELNGTNWANKQNPNNNNNNDKSNIRNDIYQFPMAPSSLPILHCVVPEPKVKNTIVVNGRSDYGKIPIAPRPPQGSFQNPFDINRMRNGGFDANSIHKLVPLNNRQYVANIKGKVYKKRKIAPNDEANSAKVAKISNGNEPKNAVAPVTPLVTQAPAMPPMAPNHSTVSAPVSNSPTLTPANDQSDSRKCLESAKGNNKKSNKDSSSAKCDNDVQKMDSNDDEGGKEKFTTNAEPQLLDASESSDCKSPSHMEERASRESPPPNSLVIVTSPEDSAKSPQPSTTSSKKDDKSKEKTRKQKSLDEVVKNLSMVTKEVKRNEGPTNVNGATKEGEKRGVRPFFSPLDLSSRKHMNLPVIPAPLPPTTICPTSKHYKPLASAASKSNNGNKSPSTPTAENLLRSYRNTQSSKNQSDKNCPTSAAVNGHNKTTSSAVANHQSRKSPDGTPKSLPNGAKKTMESLKNVPIAPSSASSSTNVSATRPQSGVPSSPTALPSFIPNRHVFYNKQQLDLINKFGSQFFNSAMLYNNMVRPSRDGLSNKAPKKL